MDSIAQSQALDEMRAGPRDRARFWRARRFGDMECLTARFQHHHYAPHTHDTYVMGVIVAGCETFRLEGVRLYAGPGSFAVVHPGEVHDGEPYGDHYAYRMSYPSVGLIRAIAEEIVGRAVRHTPRFRETLVDDPQVFSLFAAAHRQLERGGDLLACDERFVSAYGAALRRYGDIGAPPAARRESGPVARVRNYLDDNYTAETDLATLAGVARLSRYQLIRAFRREVGLTPHAYLTDRRVKVARELLRGGGGLADVAASCGFVDQSHLSRVFKARVGVPPGVFRAA